jgi:hypothetical protein
VHYSCTRSERAAGSVDRGGCRGWTFRVSPEREAEILEYLDSRELVTDVYRRKRLPVTTGSRRVVAWGYVVRREHPQYAGQLAPEQLLDLVRRGVGRSGVRLSDGEHPKPWGSSISAARAAKVAGGPQGDPRRLTSSSPAGHVSRRSPPGVGDQPSVAAQAVPAA